MDEQKARALLELAAGTAMPPVKVDVMRARRSGLRRVWLRRAGLAGGPAMAVVAVVAIAASVGPAAGRNPAQHRQAPADGQVAPPKRFNPLIPYAAFGWLPRGAALDGGQITATNMYLTAGRNPRNWALTVYVAGRCDQTSAHLLSELRKHQRPRLSCTTSRGSGWSEQVSARAGTVAGHPGFWTTDHGALAWEYARGSWAVLSLVRTPDARRKALTIASHVRYNVATKPAIEFPAQLTGLPATSRVSYTYFIADAGVLRASEYSLTSRPNGAMFTTNPAKAGVSCYVYPDGQSRHRRINGYRVTVTHLPARPGVPPLQQVCAADADGLFVFVSTYGQHPRPDAVAIFARHLRLLGPDPANWTTQPIR